MFKYQKLENLRMSVCFANDSGNWRELKIL